MDIYRQNEILGQLNAKARSDDLFKAMLLANPAVVLQTEGFHFDESLTNRKLLMARRRWTV